MRSFYPNAMSSFVCLYTNVWEPKNKPFHEDVWILIDNPFLLLRNIANSSVIIAGVDSTMVSIETCAQ